MRLAAATEADLPFIMETERRDGYVDLVGRWDAARHRAALTDGRHAYFVGGPDGQALAGFGILRDWASPERVTLLKRLAVAEPGQGHGRRLLAAIAAAVFERTEAHRLWLGVFPDNGRARRAYEATGFLAEGVARGNAFFGGVHRDELVMSLLRPDWERARGITAPAT